MVEVPAAAVCIDAILRETDFISIGSNDLIQYLVAADRDNPKVAHLCEPLSPAIFRVLHMVLDACRRTGTPATLAIGGTVCLISALIFGRRLPHLRELVRPIYARLGILPEVATGIQAATHLTTPRQD